MFLPLLLECACVSVCLIDLIIKAVKIIFNNFTFFDNDLCIIRNRKKNRVSGIDYEYFPTLREYCYETSSIHKVKGDIYK